MNSLVKEILGFDPFADHFRSINDLVKAAYPKYNLVKNADKSFVLEIAVAGFKKEELDVEQKGNTLIIEGRPSSEIKEYIHKGISTKPFKMLFPISVDWQLKSVGLFDGLLKFSFVTKETERSQKIQITTAPEVPMLEEKV